MDVYVCPICGEFALEFEVQEYLKKRDSESDRRKAACCLFEYRLRPDTKKGRRWVAIAFRQDRPSSFPGTVLVWEDDLVGNFPSNIDQRMLRAIVNLMRLSPNPGAALDRSESVVRATFGTTSEEMNWTLQELARRGWIQDVGGRITVTALGYQQAESTSKRGGPAPPPIDAKGWKLGERIGGGGQAVTYTVTRTGELESFAMKILRPWSESSKALSETEQRQRFRNEVTALRELTEAGCTGIVKVIDSDLAPSSGKQPWYVMPYYPLGPMARIEEDKVAGWAEVYTGDVDRVLDVAVQLSSVLAFMHSRVPPKVHRDVSTGNVFVAATKGEVVLGDFGLVHSAQKPGTGLTGDTQPFGPWRWRPPELDEGSDDKRNPKSDIYLLGGLIYEALAAGRHIPRPEHPRGSFKHERPDFTIARYTSDHRVPLVNRLLCRMFAEDPEARLTAVEVREAASLIRSATLEGKEHERLTQVIPDTNPLRQIRIQAELYHPGFIPAFSSTTAISVLTIENDAAVGIGRLRIRATFYRDDSEIGTKVFDLAQVRPDSPIVRGRSSAQGCIRNSKRLRRKGPQRFVPDFLFSSDDTVIGGRATRADIMPLTFEPFRA